mmetsp:Transcript_5883/g.16537  ORF Transcript_5883/g.16537 Transcript_5883/m.16537 type:complete len:221 (+) Transcript_5883:906-1568(+)
MPSVCLRITASARQPCQFASSQFHCVTSWSILSCWCCMLALGAQASPTSGSSTALRRRPCTAGRGARRHRSPSTAAVAAPTMRAARALSCVASSLVLTQSGPLAGQCTEFSTGCAEAVTCPSMSSRTVLLAVTTAMPPRWGAACGSCRTNFCSSWTSSESSSAASSHLTASSASASPRKLLLRVQVLRRSRDRTVTAPDIASRNATVAVRSLKEFMDIVM